MLFEEQVSRKPNKYPWTQEIIDALWTSHWTPNEFNFRSDYAQFKTDLTEEERGVVVRTLSAIGQIEIAVKRFWADLGNTFKHPSMSDMGLVMGNNEVIHNLAYEKLLDVLRLQDAFDEALKEPVVQGRVNYLKKYNERAYDDDRKQFIYAIILFTLFVENASLFGQFYTIMHFNRFRNVLKDTAQQVQYTRNEECYAEGTEVLTPRGWRDILSMEVGDPIFQFNPDGTLTETKVLAVTSRPYEGTMMRFSRKGNSALVTPDHDMVVRYVDDAPGEFRRVKAKDVKFHKKMVIPRTARASTASNRMTPEQRVFVAVQADGHHMRLPSDPSKYRGSDGGFNYSIALKKERKIERLRGILNESSIRWGERCTSDGYTVFSVHLDVTQDYKTFRWVSLSEGVEWCRDFVEELSHWDGWTTDTGQRGYCSTVKENIDVAQAVGVLAGYHTKIIPKEDTRSDSFSDSWRIYFTDVNPLPISHAVSRLEEEFCGMVGCVTVPSGAILTRHNDDTFIAGNCLHARAGILLINTLRQEYPEYFDEELEARVAQECIEAVEHEGKIVDWMLQDYTGEAIDAPTLKAFIKKRIVDGLKDIGFEGVALTAEEKALLPKTRWMDEETKGATLTDFFQKRPVEYAKGHRSYDEDDLF